MHARGGEERRGGGEGIHSLKTGTAMGIKAWLMPGEHWKRRKGKLLGDLPRFAPP